MIVNHKLLHFFFQIKACLSPTQIDDIPFVPPKRAKFNNKLLRLRIKSAFLVDDDIISGTHDITKVGRPIITLYNFFHRIHFPDDWWVKQCNKRLIRTQKQYDNYLNINH
jgi:hypothetical protein